jgi:hypothetical protein
MGGLKRYKGTTRIVSHGSYVSVRRKLFSLTSNGTKEAFARHFSNVPSVAADLP